MLWKCMRIIPKRVSNQCYGSTVAAVQQTPLKNETKSKPSLQKKELLISCKRSEFNMKEANKSVLDFGAIPLASKGWYHYKSKGDYFTIHPKISAEQLKNEMQNIDTFLQSNAIRFDENLIKNVKNTLDISQFTEIQKLGIPEVYNGNHVLLAAETGCGKTISFILPIIQKLLELKRSQAFGDLKDRKMNTPLALIITPGRELATQICNVTQELCNNVDIKVKVLLGGNTKRLMTNPEFEDVDVLVATIGALSKLVTTGIYRIQEVRHLVLDEADTLLDDSFTDKLKHLLSRFSFLSNSMKKERTQLIMSSATLPTNIEAELKNIIDVETLDRVISSRLHHIMPHVEQRFRRISKAERPVKLLNLAKLEKSRRRPLIIFSNKSATCDFISQFLNSSGVHCLNLNGDMLMKIRIGRFEEYQNGKCDVLSTTDIASRGLDTCRTGHVLNFDFPMHVSDYIHRCGRIGRISNVDNKFLVTNFISSRREIDLVQRIEHAARTSGILSNVNANIKGLIKKSMEKELKAARNSFEKKENEDAIFP